MISVPSAGRRPKKKARRSKKRRRLRRERRQHASALRFSPYAWAKLLYLRDRGDTEVGGFGITRPDDLLFVEDVRLVRQWCSSVTVEFDDEAVADFFDQQVDSGRRPEEFARVWLHTHPGNSPRPSGTDEATFERCFGTADWAVMFVLARGGATYARLRFGVGPGGQTEIPVQVDFQPPFPGSDHAAWEAEYQEAVEPVDLGLAEFFGGRPEGEGRKGLEEEIWLRAWEQDLDDRQAPLAQEDAP